VFALIWTIFIALVVWLMLVRPQRRRVMAHAAMVRAVEVGHQVITAGGLHGRVQALDDDTVSLEIAPGVVVRVDRRAIARDLDLIPHVSADDDVAAEDGE